MDERGSGERFVIEGGAPISGTVVPSGNKNEALPVVAAALMVVFVESVIVTYFIGTSRWCREVVETYHFDPDFIRRSNQLKRRTFPWALAGMLAVVGVIALGAASDPATGRPNTAAWVNWHLAGAFSGILLISWTYVVAWNNVASQHAIIEELVANVAKAREKQGLEMASRAG